CACCHALKQFVFGNLESQLSWFAGAWIARPKQNAVAIGIAGSDAFRKKLAAFTPGSLRTARFRPTPCGRCPPTGRGDNKCAAIHTFLFLPRRAVRGGFIRHV